MTAGGTGVFLFQSDPLYSVNTVGDQQRLGNVCTAMGDIKV